MSCTKFKISMVAASVFAATTANAALYQIVEVGPVSGYEAGISNGTDITEFYGSVITKQRKTTDVLGCFAELCTSADTKLAGDTRAGTEGHSYREEVPFNMDVSFYYKDWGRNRDYCRSELGYQTCDPAWTNKLWYSFSDHGGLSRERDAWLASEYRSNAQSFINDQLFAINQPLSDYQPSGFNYSSTSSNVVVNGIDSGNVLIGNTSSGYYTKDNNSALIYRHRGFWGTSDAPSVLLPIQDNDITQKMGRTMAFDSFDFGGKRYVTGSAAVAPFDYTDENKNYRGSVSNCINNSTINADPAAYADCQNFAFATKAAIWEVPLTEPASGNNIPLSAVYNWQNTTSNNIEKKASQGSIRAAIVSKTTAFGDKPVFVGFNTTKNGDNLFLQATVFTPQNSVDVSDPGAWKSTVINGTFIKSSNGTGDDYIYTNSMATDINEQLVLIGEAKRRGDKRENGAAANRMFLAQVNDGGGASASYFDELNGNSGIFFRGVGGKTGAINNFNEIVGAVDAEQATEFYGKKRRQRGFIYPYTVVDANNPDMVKRRDVFQNKPWLLDDLTNGGIFSAENNKYRIIDAADINDDGVIAATAIKCPTAQGYDTTGHNSYCGNGQTTEKVVAVKLIPISNANERSITPRAIEAPPVERKGGSLGWMAMIFLGFLGLRRNK